MDEIQILRIPANIESDKDSLNQQQTDTLIKQTEYLEDYVLLTNCSCDLKMC